jgi:hypothetical protein
LFSGARSLKVEICVVDEDSQRIPVAEQQNLIAPHRPQLKLGWLTAPYTKAYRMKLKKPAAKKGDCPQVVRGEVARPLELPESTALSRLVAVVRTAQ